MQTVIPRILLVLCALVVLAGLAGDAFACACCSNRGQRNIATVKLDDYRLTTIKAVRFAEEAFLYVGVADADEKTGIAKSGTAFALKAEWRKSGLVFSLRDPNGNAGTLSLPTPSTVTVFEIDPRTTKDEGLGPPLYKEWTIAARPAGTGIFTPGLGPAQRLSLILHGGGRGCTEASDFTHWTLQMRGPKGNYHLFGDLAPPQ